MNRALRFLPLLVLIAFVGAVAWRLSSPADQKIPSKMIGQPVPTFALAPAIPGRQGLSSADFSSGRPRLINVFASWCVPCIAEAPLLTELKHRGLPIDAIAVRDRPEDVAAFIERNGDPFDRIGADPESQVQLALGSSGVPETFVIDGRGVVRYQHMGPIEPGDVAMIVQEWEAAK
ncbi:DsbE family thiol:disulfide interchange protein [Sphingomonas sp. G124]|uniref:DsbE family thiol:disulfide interchange protein n=1 Tax=Sphingomonas cremea TaxID=2904799 RepID=A0A9X1QLK2_9SPHN|nr:DsbE family thiol:disulfide interchange protein [Sphingomonas cremea]MCF2514262.1 DsbE family thiol:disulfide interchange protein [Sphingomonas cremea]